MQFPYVCLNNFEVITIELPSKSKLGLSLLSLFFVVSVIYISLPYQSSNFIGTPDPAEAPQLSADYLPEQENLKLVVEEGEFTHKSNIVDLKLEPKDATESMGVLEDKRNFRIKGYNKTRDTDIWAIKSLYGLEITSSGVTSFPIEENESITIIEDGTDVDNDSVNGVENGETVSVHTRNGEKPTFVQSFEVTNNTTRKLENYSSTKPKPVENFLHKKYLIYIDRIISAVK